MDEIQRLERQIRDLQQELRRQNDEAERMRRNLEDENRRKLQAYQSEMRNNLDQHDREVQREYERLLREYQRSADAGLQEQQLRMDEDYQKILAGVRQKEQEWNEKSRELENLIAQLKQNEQERDSESAKEADKYMTQAALTYKEIEKKPHEKFFPKRLLTFYNAIREARTLFKSGLNEAAIAISISARSGLNRLGYELDDELEEWKRQYFIFKNKVGLMHLKLADEVLQWRNSLLEVSGNDISEEEKCKFQNGINFWSRGRYGDLCNRIAEFGREIAKIEKQGIEEYLKDESSISSDDLKKSIDELDSMSGEFDDVAVGYQAGYKAACERADWGEMIIDFMEDEVNLTWNEQESHFRETDAEVIESSAYCTYMKEIYGPSHDRVDLREWLELVFENPMGTRIYIYIVPYEKKTEVENRLVIYVDYNGAENVDYSRQIYEHIRQSIHLTEDDGVINFATEVGQLTTNANETLRETGRSIEKKIQKVQ